MSSSFVAPWIWAPSSNRSRRRRRKRTTKRTSSVCTSTKIRRMKIETKSQLRRMPSAFGDAGSTGVKPPLSPRATGTTTRASSEPARTRSARTACHSMKVGEESTTRTRVRLPRDVVRPFEVYVNGVPQREGDDFDVDGRTLVFDRELKTEGKLGFWRWTSIFVGIAGTYRQNDSVDVVYTRGGRRVVAAKLPLEPA